MKPSDITVLVTGAAGFIGAFVAARLAATGYRVVGCDNFNAYYSPTLKQARVAQILHPLSIPCETVELAEVKQVETLFEKVQPTHVVHLAAQAGVRYSLQCPQAYIQSNLVGFGHILEACRHQGVAHLVYASSSSVYGATTRVPFHESDATDQPVSLYAATKKANELMAHTYSHLYGLPTTGLRFFTVYGPWGRPDMAYFSFTQKMLKGEKIPVFARGELQRDFTYIEDIVEGVTQLLGKPYFSQEGHPPAAVFNIGNHQPVRVIDFISTLERVLGVPAEIDYLPMQAGDVPVTCADTTALHNWVGFAPCTPLELGLTRFAHWYREWEGQCQAAPADSMV